MSVGDWLGLDETIVAHAIERGLRRLLEAGPAAGRRHPATGKTRRRR